jgi:hypothetical protein
VVAGILTLEFYRRSDIREAIEKAKQLSALLGVLIKFEFNGIEMLISESADTDLMVTRYYDFFVSCET